MKLFEQSTLMPLDIHISPEENEARSKLINFTLDQMRRNLSYQIMEQIKDGRLYRVRLKPLRSEIVYRTDQWGILAQSTECVFTLEAEVVSEIAERLFLPGDFPLDQVSTGSG